MAEVAIAHIGKAKRVADDAGIGTFSSLCRKAQVHAVETTKATIKALDQGARMNARVENLQRRTARPVPPAADDLEFKHFDAVVFDPPRAVPKRNAPSLHDAGVKKIVAISCNPLTLARDLSILIAGGYRIDQVTPIDQFLWSPHVEAVVTLSKG